MRVILLNLPWNSFGRLGVRAGSRWPFTSKPEKDGQIHYIPFPFFLAYSAALLKKKNNEVKLIDAIAEGLTEDELISQIKLYNPKLIIIESSTPSFENDLKITSRIGSKLINSQIVLCGSHASAFPKLILKEHNFINYILIGEYEYSLLNLVNCLENRLGFKGAEGLAYRDNGIIKVNNRRKTLNLDSLPWPERNDIPIYKYNDGFAGLPAPNVQMLASRGCPFRCNFCLWPQVIYGEHRYRKRNPIDVVDEMGWLINSFGFKAVYFDDDIFNADKRYVLDICKEIMKRKIKIPWAVMARADFMDEEILQVMAFAGLYAVKYGVESASRQVLDYCKKDMDLNKAFKMINFTKKLGIKVHLTFCLGLPHETRQTIQETINFIKNLGPDSLQFSFATPFPGTEYFSYLEEKGWLMSRNWLDYDGARKCVVRTQELSNKDLEEIRIDLNSNFNL